VRPAQSGRFRHREGYSPPATVPRGPGAQAVLVFATRGGPIQELARKGDMKTALLTAIRDGFLALLAFISVVSVYMCVDQSGSGVPDWRVGRICGVLHGHVDFVPPAATITLGAYRGIMFFRHSTVVRSGGTYLDFGMNGALLFGSILGAGVLLGMVLGRRKKNKANQASDAT